MRLLRDRWRGARFWVALTVPSGHSTEEGEMIALSPPLLPGEPLFLTKAALLVSKFRPQSPTRRPKSRGMTHPGNKPSLLARGREAWGQGAWVQV